jgi:hypothetical protein
MASENPTVPVERAFRLKPNPSLLPGLRHQEIRSLLEFPVSAFISDSLLAGLPARNRMER